MLAMAGSTDTSEGGDRALIERHLEHMAYLGRRAGTIAQRRWYLGRLAERIAPIGLLGVEPEHLTAFVAQAQLGPEARNNAVTHAQGFYRWARRLRLVDVDPSEELERPRRPRRRPRPMPEVELARAIGAAPEPIRSWIMLGAFAGLRCCEIAPLRGEDVDLQHGLLVIREQKGGDEGEVPLGAVLDALVAQLPARGWWFERWDGLGGPISANQLQRHGNRFLHSLGIDHTMHTLRHRFITQVYELSGHDLVLTQRLARHRNPSETVKYTALRDHRAGEVARLLTVPG